MHFPNPQGRGFVCHWGFRRYFGAWLASIELYWPYATWPVYLILDEEDRAAAESPSADWPPWLTLFQPPQPTPEKRGPSQGKESSTAVKISSLGSPY